MFPKKRRLINRWKIYLGLCVSIVGIAILYLSNPLFADPPQDVTPRMAHIPAHNIGHVPNEVLVKFKQGLHSNDMGMIHSQMETDFIDSLPGIRTHRVRSRRGDSVESLLQAYANHPDVEYVEPNGLFHTTVIPNDPRFSDLYGLHNTGQTGGASDSDIDAPEAWDLQTGSNSIIVADIDTGVDYNHEDLIVNIWTNAGEIAGNGIDDDGNGYIDDIRGWDFVNGDNDPADDRGHGTHTAGTIAAVGNNGLGVAGVSWNTQIIPLKFLNSSGSGTFAAAAQAIIYAADMGAQISSNSWGCLGCFSQTVEDAIAYADSKGLLFVVSAGNDSNNNDLTTAYPCTSSQENVICVAATDDDDLKAGFSNYGETTVDLGAPGVNILSTVPTIGCTLCDPTGYRYLSGTSMAAPHVSGAAALLLANNPSLTSNDLIRILLDSTDPIPSLSGITVTGGRLNINNALLINFTVSTDPENATVLKGESTSIDVSINSFNGFSAPVTLGLISPDPTITGTFDINPATPPSDGSIQSVLTISATAESSTDTYQLTITATDALGETRSTNITLTVTGPDYQILVSPAQQIIIPGDSTSFTIIVVPISGYLGQVTLNMATSDPAISGVFSPNPVTIIDGGSQASTLTVSTTASVGSGAHSLLIEGTDGVSVRSISTILGIFDTDLVVTDISGSPTASMGSRILVPETVLNKSTVATIPLFALAIYLSDDPIITTSDILLYPQRWIQNLGPGESSTGNLSVLVPNTLVEGATYYWGAIVDFQNDVTEVFEDNNALAGNTTQATIEADLVMTQVSGPSFAAPGGSITIVSTALNQGTASADTGFAVGLYLSDDTNITENDTFLRYTGEGAVLDPGETKTANTTFNLSTSIPDGIYYLGAFVDDNHQLLETNEGNNGLAGNTITIVSAAGPPDLVMTTVTGPSSVEIDSCSSFSDIVLNQGLGPAMSAFDVGLYLSDDQLITTGDIFVGSRFVNGLSSGVSSSATTRIDIPNTIAEGPYFVGAIADYLSQLVESNELNNSLSGNAIQVIQEEALVFLEDIIDNGATYPSVAVDSAGALHLTYFDTATFDIKYARWTGIGWDIQIIGNTNSGGNTSLGLDPYNVPHISHQDSSAYLVYTYWDGGNWVSQIVDNTPGGTGTYNSLALDTAGHPHIAYYRLNSGDGDLVYAKWTGTAWNIEVIDSLGDVGRFVSLALDSQDLPHIAYLENINPFTSRNLKYTFWNGTDWDTQTLDFGGGSAAEYISLAVDQLDLPHISYDFGPALKYAHWTGTQWKLEVVDSSGSNTNIIIDSNNNPHISYFVGGSSTAVKYAEGKGPGCWKLHTVASDVAAYLASFTALGLDSSGSPQVVYNDPTANTLILAAPPSANTVPVISLLQQREYDGVCNGNESIVPVGGTLTGQSICLEGDIGDSDGDNIRLELEVRLTGSAFSGSANFCSPANCSNFTSQGVVVSSVTGLAVDVGYHWQARAVDDFGNASAWTSFGSGNSETEADFNTAGLPDLVTTVVSGPSTAPMGSRIPVSDTILNQGTGGISGIIGVGLYLSDDPNITTTDIELYPKRFIQGLGAGESSSGVSNVLIPGNLTEGATYYIGAIVDYNNFIAESDESNNALAGNTTQATIEADLVMTQVSGPSSGAPGSSITVTNTVLNQGTSSADTGFWVGLYLSVDATITSDDTFLLFRVGGILGPGQSSTVNTTVTIPSSMPPGTYYLGAIADTFGQLTETDEGNNSLAGNTIAIGPDLVMTNVSGPSTAALGGYITLSDTILNQGTADAAGLICIRYFLSTDPDITTTDTRIYPDRFLENGLAAGASSSGSLNNVRVPISLTEGATYYIGAIADCNDAIPESSETNNALAGNTTQATIEADLVMTQVSGPSSAAPGGSITIVSTALNQGTSTAATGFFVGLYLSDDAIITEDDLFLRFTGEGTILAPGETKTANTTFNLSTTIPNGTYYLGAFVDDNHQLPETDEGNNGLAGNTIAIGPDLVMANVSGPSTAPLGGYITLSDTVLNQGASDAAGLICIRYFLSTDPDITTTDTRIYPDRFLQNGLAAGASSSGSLNNVIVPISLTEGATYYIGAIADCNDAIPESSETNNALAGNTTQATIEADLVMTQVSGPSSAAPGGSITIVSTALNQGTSTAATGFFVGLYLSDDAIITEDDIFLRFTNEGAILAPGETKTANTTFNLSTSIPSGTYYLGAYVDDNHQLPETDEGNNGLAGNTIAIGPDLVMTFLAGPSGAAPGSQIILQDVVQNNGVASANSFSVGFYLSTDITITTSDIFLGDRAVGSLASGANDTATTTLTVPTSVSVGTYYLGAIADYTGIVLESDESNNSFGRNTPTLVNTQFTLNINKVGAGSGTVTSIPVGIDCGADCSETYPTGTVVTLTATPDPGSVFTTWSQDADCTDGAVTMDFNRNCTAGFASVGTVDDVKLEPGDSTISIGEVQTLSVEALNTTGQTLKKFKIEYDYSSGLDIANLQTNPSATKTQVDTRKRRIKLEWRNVPADTLITATFDVSSGTPEDYNITVRKVESRLADGTRIDGTGNNAVIHVIP